MTKANLSRNVVVPSSRPHHLPYLSPPVPPPTPPPLLNTHTHRDSCSYLLVGRGRSNEVGHTPQVVLVANITVGRDTRGASLLDKEAALLILLEHSRHCGPLRHTIGHKLIRCRLVEARSACRCGRHFRFLTSSDLHGSARRSRRATVRRSSEIEEEGLDAGKALFVVDGLGDGR